MVPNSNERTESMGGFDRKPDRPRIERLGHFKIEATLGCGGMGTIYRAYDESMKRPVALKVLHSSLEISERAQSRFVREAWIAGQLDHPNIIKVFSRGEENKVSYLALELAEGGSLSDLVEQTRESIPSGSDMTDTVGQDYIKDILAKFVELAGALEHIHSKGFIHRDIKPHNVLLSGADKKFKLTDFGIAHAKDMTRMTQAGDFIGTVRYMSPELLAAHRAGIDKRTDIYSLGVTLYEALTLILPFKADSEEKLIGEILAGHYTEARKANRRIPVDLETVLMKACNHDPDLRYQTAAEFADDLQRIIDGRPVLARRQSAISKGIKYIRRNYKVVTAVVAAVAIIAVTILWSLSRMGQLGGSDTDRPSFTEIRIPTYPGNGILSPDGEWLAFCSDWVLWVVPLHGKVDPNMAGEPVKLTDRISAWNYGNINHMAWSRDGKQIAFNVQITDSTSEIFIVPSDGGEPGVVPVALHRGNWIVNFRLSLSPDGTRLAYSSADEPWNEPHTGPPLSPLFIHTVSVDGGGERQVTSIPSREAVFSPDGGKIAFIAGGRLQELADTTIRLYDRPELAVYVVNALGGQPILVADLPGWESYPIWSPDGRMIAFSYWSEEDKHDIRIVSLLEDGSPEADPIVIEPPTQEFKLAGWSINNQIGICSSEPDHAAIYTVAASGGRAVQITPEGYNQHPRWTPDGLRIYYHTESDEVAWVSAEGGVPKVIPHLSADWEPRFYPHYYGSGNAVSPDGSALVVSGTKKGVEGTHIWIMSIEGSELRQITSSPPHYEDCYPCWSPGGDSIAFTRSKLGDSGETVQCNIFVVSIDGGEPRQVTSDVDSVAWSIIDWSPDGQTIAYRSYHRTEQNRRGGLIKTISVNGGASKMVTEVKGAYVTTSLTWSPDGTRVAYDYDSKSIQVVSLEDSTITEVKTGLGDVRIYFVSWSPDGEKITFAGFLEGDEKFYLIDNFLPEE
jgi:serine/threonine protein kinase